MPAVTSGPLSALLLPATSVDANPTNICYNTPGTYSVSLIATNSIGSDTLTLNNFITVYPYPPPQGIAQSGDTLFANMGSVTYQWYYSGTLIPGATDYFYVAPQSGDYNVVCTDANGCEVEAVIFDVSASAPSISGGEEMSIFPNPVADKLTIQNLKITGNTDIEIYNVIGEKVFSTQLFPGNQNHQTTFDVSSLARGWYWLEIIANDKTWRKKFMKK